MTWARAERQYLTPIAGKQHDPLDDLCDCLECGEAARWDREANDRD